MVNGLSLLIFLAAVQAGPAAHDSAEKAADSQDKVICKRFVETGSLVRGYRTCKTKREWERERDALRTETSGNACKNPGSPTCT